MEKSPANIFSLEGKDVWVLGGAGYLGQPTVAALVALGAKVLCVDLQNRAQSFVESSGLKTVSAASLDCRDGDAVKKFVAEQIAVRGVPHGLVNLTFASTSKK